MAPARPSAHAETDLGWMPATELAGLIRRKRVSPVEVVDAVLDAVDELRRRAATRHRRQQLALHAVRRLGGDLLAPRADDAHRRHRARRPDVVELQRHVLRRAEGHPRGDEGGRRQQAPEAGRCGEARPAANRRRFFAQLPCCRHRRSSRVECEAAQ